MNHKRKKTPDNALFAAWAASLPDNQRMGILRIIADACDVRIRTVQRWREYGPIRQSFKNIIEEIAGESIFLTPNHQSTIPQSPINNPSITNQQSKPL